MSDEPQTEEEFERPPLLARPTFWVPLLIICLGGAVYKRRGDEKQRLGAVWEQRCLGNAQCDAHVRQISNYCHGEVIGLIRPRSPSDKSQRQRYTGCVVSIVRDDLEFDIDPPRDLRVNYF